MNLNNINSYKLNNYRVFIIYALILFLSSCGGTDKEPSCLLNKNAVTGKGIQDVGENPGIAKSFNELVFLSGIIETSRGSNDVLPPLMVAAASIDAKHLLVEPGRSYYTVQDVAGVNARSSLNQSLSQATVDVRFDANDVVQSYAILWSLPVQSSSVSIKIILPFLGSSWFVSPKIEVLPPHGLSRESTDPLGLKTIIVKCTDDKFEKELLVRTDADGFFYQLLLKGSRV